MTDPLRCWRCDRPLRRSFDWTLYTGRVVPLGAGCYKLWKKFVPSADQRPT